MASGVQGTFVNYYEVLGVAENATSLTIQEALNTYRESLQAQMNNPLSMGPARSAMNEIVPVIERLLSDEHIRADYDQQLATSRRKQTAKYEPADDEGLEDTLRIPFLFNAGSFISDLPARTDLILGHEGVRGCVFVVIESHTSWVTFDNGQSSVRFALMPEGSEPEIGASEVKIPLFFKVDNLMRNTNHSALLVLRMENQVRAVEQSVQVVIHIQPLPPRVVFEPEATRDTPAWAGIARRSVPTSVVVTPCNYGDEGLVPLSARIAAKDN